MVKNNKSRDDSISAIAVIAERKNYKLHTLLNNTFVSPVSKGSGHKPTKPLATLGG